METFLAQLHLLLPWPLLIGGIALLAFGLLLAMTKGFSQGRLILHWATFILVIISAVIGFGPVVVLTVTLFNAAIWILLGLIPLAFIVSLFWILFQVFSAVP
jgi:hypothetical protein